MGGRILSRGKPIVGCPSAIERHQLHIGPCNSGHPGPRDMAAPAFQIQTLRPYRSLRNGHIVSRPRPRSLSRHADYRSRACIASAVNLHYRIVLLHDPTDLTYMGFAPLLTTCVELELGVICACMPACAGKLKKFVGTVRQRRQHGSEMSDSDPSTAHALRVGHARAQFRQLPDEAA